jgi:hypothetical protein
MRQLSWTRNAGCAELARLVPDAPDFASPGAGPPATAEDTFATTARKEELAACLTTGEAEQVGAASASALSAGRQAVPAPAWDLARDWASGDRLYSLAPLSARPLPRRAVPSSGPSCPVRWVPGAAAAACSGGTCWSPTTS